MQHRIQPLSLALLFFAVSSVAGQSVLVPTDETQSGPQSIVQLADDDRSDMSMDWLNDDADWLTSSWERSGNLQRSNLSMLDGSRDYRQEVRQEIRSMDILERPHRRFHVYGNTVRRRHHRGAVPVRTLWQQ